MTFDLSSLGWDDAFATTYGRSAAPDREPARVTRVDSGVCTALGARGVLRASLGGCLLAVSAADLARLPCPGDWIVVQHWPDERTTVERVLPRRTAITLADGADGTMAQVLAANVDTVAVVVSALAPDHGDIARLLGLARAAGTQVIVIVTRPDRGGAEPDRVPDFARSPVTSRCMWWEGALAPTSSSIRSLCRRGPHAGVARCAGIELVRTD